MTNGIRFKNKHSYKDFNITLAPGKEIGTPNKNKIKVAIPFSNTEYDFSELYGDQTYSPRSLTYSFNIFDTTKTRMNNKKTEIINWLMNSNGKQKLYDDAYPGYYFLAEVEGNVSFEEDRSTGILTVTFTAYPFMIAERQEGHDIWDEFNFDLDVAQDVEFAINNTLDVVLLNVGTPSVIPEIQASAQMEIVKDGITYIIPSGTTKSSDFILKLGENDLTINGDGTIKFTFYKELI